MSSRIDEQVKHKLDGLEALEAGIVYGREDAWDKLQTRIEQPRRTIALPTWKTAAIAATLLLAVTIGYWVLKPANDPVNIAVAPAAIAEPQPAANTIPVVAETPTIVVQTKKHYMPKHTTPPLLATQPVPEPVHVAETQPIPLPEQTPVTAQPPKSAMGVVHVNELYKPAERIPLVQQEASPFPHVQFKMKVVHINELYAPVRQEEYMREAERNTVMSLPFRSRFSADSTGRPLELFRINLSKKSN